MRETLRMTRRAGIRSKGYLMIGHPTEKLDSLAETAEFLSQVELDICQVTKFTPYPGTPAYSTIQQYGSFEEDWEKMNAMNFVFIPDGLSEEELESYFDHLYRRFYSRPDILFGLLRLLLKERSLIKRFASNVYVYMRNRISWGSIRLGALPAEMSVNSEVGKQGS